MRLFIAIGLPDDIKEYLSTIQEKMIGQLSHEDKIIQVKKEHIHLTLKFLGEVQPNNIKEIKDALKEIKLAPFSIELGIIGVFPSEDNIRVIWVGLKPEDKIMELQKNIDESLKTLFKKEKSFKAHITLARVNYIKGKAAFISKLKGIKVDNKEICISSFKLIKSTLTPKGSVYEGIEHLM